MRTQARNQQKLTYFDILVLTVMQKDGRASDGTTLANTIFFGEYLRKWHFAACRRSLDRLLQQGAVKLVDGWYYAVNVQGGRGKEWQILHRVN